MENMPLHPKVAMLKGICGGNIRASNLQGMRVLMYEGGGINKYFSSFS